VVRDERVGAAYPGAKVRHAHPGFALGDRAGPRAGGVGEEHEHAEPQRISDGPKAAKQILSSRCEHSEGS
jgi:hypothetical protein